MERLETLVGELALRMGLMTRAQLDLVTSLAASRHERSFLELLRERCALQPGELAALEQLARARIARLGGSSEGPAPDGSMDRTVRLAGGTMAGSARSVPPPAHAEGDRYRLGRDIGRGGLGRVVAALDRNFMDREVAMKLLHDGGTGEETARATGEVTRGHRLLEEARITGQLWHPNIVPVLEIGVRPDGALYYTMPVLRGESLRSAIASAHGRLARGEVPPSDWGLERLKLLTSFQGVCHAIAYAHSCGVIHRDVKPANVMVGPYGETVVVDWGLAKVKASAGAASAQEPAGGGRPPSLEGTDGGTVEGTVNGTPAYMSPEQAAGRVAEVDERSDVYSLGAVLFEILTGRPPFVADNVWAVLLQVKDGPTPDPRTAGGPPVPDDLAAIVLRAMARDRSARYASAEALLADVVAAIDGGKQRHKRHEEAERLVRLGTESARSYLDLRAEHQRLRGDARALGGRFRGGEPVEAKAGWWRAEDEAAAVAQSIVGAFAEAERLFHQALEFEPGNAGGRAGLADLYWIRFLKEDADGLPAEARYYRDLVKTYHDGRYARELQGDGTVTILSEPADAAVHLYRYEERGRRLIPTPWKGPPGWEPPGGAGETPTTAGWYLRPDDADPSTFVGTTPVAALPVPMGSYLALLRREGYPVLRCPIHVGRNEDASALVPLVTRADIGDGYAVVPAGAFISGGDPKAQVSERTVRETEAFLIGRYPVTCAEYLAFLNDLGARDPSEARRHTPRWQEQGGIHWIEDPEGTWRLPQGKDAFGYAWSPDFPVVDVTWHDAKAYCAWRSRRDGRKISLPSAAEWEKAARGTDGRFHPWGDYFDPSWSNTRTSRIDGEPRLGPVGEFPVDESPYGVRDLGGNVLDWCTDAYAPGPEWRVARGGAWIDGGIRCRAALLTGHDPVSPYLYIGFRLRAELARSGTPGASPGP